MKSLAKTIPIRSVTQPDQWQPSLILVLSAVLLSVHRYFGSIEFASGNLHITSNSDSAVFMFAAAFVLMGLIPGLVVVAVFRSSLGSYGVRLGDWRAGLKALLILMPLAFLMLIPIAQTVEMRLFYPLDPRAGDSISAFVRFECLRGLLFYTAWEFFFRGFMLFGLRKAVGDWLAISIQTVPSCLWHIGCPTGEIFSSILGGFLFGLMALRTGSVFWPFLLHCFIGIGLDWLIAFGN